MGEYNQQFRSFDEWVNKASSWLTRRGKHVRAICFDSKGRMCCIGRDSMRARDDSAFPVHWVWSDQAADKIVVSFRDAQPFAALAAGDGVSK